MAIWAVSGMVHAGETDVGTRVYMLISVERIRRCGPTAIYHLHAICQMPTVFPLIFVWMTCRSFHRSAFTFGLVTVPIADKVYIQREKVNGHG